MKLQITDRAGATKIIEAESGLSAMEAIRSAGFHELLALCGGSPACATCHVHVHPDWIEAVGEPSRDERDLLENSAYRTDRSRLSCQIRLVDEYDGLALTIAPAD